MMLSYIHPQLAHNDLYWADSYELDFPAFDMRIVKSNDKMNLKLLHTGFKGKKSNNTMNVGLIS